MIHALKNVIEEMGYDVPTPTQLDVPASWAAGGKQSYDLDAELNAYRDVSRLFALDKLHQIELDRETFRVRSIGSVKLTPEQFIAEVKSHYQAGLKAGFEDAVKRYENKSLPYKADIPEAMQKGLWADNVARSAVQRYLDSIGVHNGWGRVVTLNNKFLDPSGSEEFKRPDVIINLGPGEIDVLDGKTSEKGVPLSSEVKQQLLDYYRYGATRVWVTSPTEIYLFPRKAGK
jgi:hypothetical protein